MIYTTTFPECLSLSLHWSADCNMACKYCYIDKDKSAMNQYNLKIRQALADGTYVKNVKSAFPREQDRNQITHLAMWGAEPTINGEYFKPVFYELLDFFQGVTEVMFSTNALVGWERIYQQFFVPLVEYCHQNQRKIKLDLQLSLDGPPEFNDSSRHAGATENTLATLYNILKKTPYNDEYFSLRITSKATLDISYMKIMVDEGIEKFQWYYDFMNEIQDKAMSIIGDNQTVVDCQAFGIPTLVNPGYYTKADGEIFAKWLTMLPLVNRSNWCESSKWLPLFGQCTSLILDQEEITNPIALSANYYTCSAGNTGYTIDWDGTLYTCNRLCRNAALSDDFKYKGAMKSNSTIDKPSENKWNKRHYASQCFHENVQSRKDFANILILQMASMGQIDKKYLTSEQDRFILFLLISNIYCHVGVEEDYTSNIFIPAASYIRLLGNGAQSALEDYIRFEIREGVL